MNRLKRQWTFLEELEPRRLLSALTTFSGPGGTGAATATWRYNPATGNLEYKQYADGSRDSLSYFPADSEMGNYLQYETTSGGTVISYGYTADGTFDAISYAQSNGQTLSYTDDDFDRWGNADVVSENIDGGSGVRGGSTVTNYYSYDDQDRLVRASFGQVEADGGNPTAVEYDYISGGADDGDLGDMKLVDDPEGSEGGEAILVQTNYGYDASGMLDSVSGDTSASTYNYVTGEPGLVGTLTTTAGGSAALTTSYQYNLNADQLTGLTVTNGTQNVYSESYTYGEVGGANPGSHDQQIGKKTVSYLDVNGNLQSYYVLYVYDQYDQLQSANTYNAAGGFLSSEGFGNDALGNPESYNVDQGGNWSSTSYQHNILNQISSIDSSSYVTWDGDGNMTSDGQGDVFSYDGADELTQALMADGTIVNYRYDDQGRMSSREEVSADGEDEGTTDYVYDGSDLIGEIDAATGQLTRSYTWLPGAGTDGSDLLSAITTYDSNGSVSGVYRPFYNGHDDVMGLLDSSGAVAATYSYTAYGVQTASGPDANVCPLGFDGYFYDPVVNLYFTPNRVYSASLSIFLQRDPSGEANGGPNLNEPLGRDPEDNSDPSGLDWSQDRLAAVNDQIASAKARFSVLYPGQAYTPTTPNEAELLGEQKLLTGSAADQHSDALYRYALLRQGVEHIGNSAEFSWSQELSIGNWFDSDWRETRRVDSGIYHADLDEMLAIQAQYPQIAVERVGPPTIGGTPSPAEQQAVAEQRINAEAVAAAFAMSPFLPGGSPGATPLTPVAGEPPWLARLSQAAPYGELVPELSGGCFPAETLVQTPAGPRPIATLLHGDEVLAYDEKNGRVVVSRVKALLKNWTGTLIKLGVGGEIVWATRGHPIFVANAFGDAAGQYFQATTLEPGMTVLDTELKPRVVESVDCMATDEDTYNIEIEGYHTYFVGETGILVHNAGFDDPTTYDFDFYGIQQDATGKIVYVGRTVQGISTRFGQHINSTYGSHPEWAEGYRPVRLGGGNMTTLNAAATEQGKILTNGGLDALDNERNAISEATAAKYGVRIKPC